MIPYFESIFIWVITLNFKIATIYLSESNENYKNVSTFSYEKRKKMLVDKLVKSLQKMLFVLLHSEPYLLLLILPNLQRKSWLLLRAMEV